MTQLNEKIMLVSEIFKDFLKAIEAENVPIWVLFEIRRQ